MVSLVRVDLPSVPLIISKLLIYVYGRTCCEKSTGVVKKQLVGGGSQIDSHLVALRQDYVSCLIVTACNKRR
jgi:hypothetical protein